MSDVMNDWLRKPEVYKWVRIYANSGRLYASKFLTLYLKPINATSLSTHTSFTNTRIMPLFCAPA